MPRYTSRSEVTPDTLRSVAKTLREYADRYAELADRMQSADTAAIEVTNADGLRRGLALVSRHIAVTQQAADTQQLNAITAVEKLKEFAREHQRRGKS